MKTFIVTYQTNYDLGVAIINAKDLESAKRLADNNNHIWEGYNIEELDTQTEVQILSA